MAANNSKHAINIVESLKASGLLEQVFGRKRKRGLFSPLFNNSGPSDFANFANEVEPTKPAKLPKNTK